MPASPGFVGSLIKCHSDENRHFHENKRGKGSIKKNLYIHLSHIWDIEWRALECYAIGQNPVPIATALVLEHTDT